MLEWLSIHSAAMQALAAIVTSLAIVPNAILFFINQNRERNRNKTLQYETLNERRREWLSDCINFPQFALERGKPVCSAELCATDLIRRDHLFEKLSALFEESYSVHLDRRESHFADQWEGWRKYITHYFDREDYLEWWHRVVLSGDESNADVVGITEFDVRFEKFMMDIARPRLERVRRSVPALAEAMAR